MVWLQLFGAELGLNGQSTHRIPVVNGLASNGIPYVEFPLD